MTTLTKQIRNQQKAIGLEGFESITEFAKRFHDFRLYDKLKSRVSEIFNPTRNFVNVNSRIDTKVTKWLLDVGYPNLTDFTVYVPLGLVSNVKTYVEVLEGHNRIMDNLIDDLIAPTINMFGIILNDPDMLKSHSGVVTGLTRINMKSTTEMMAKDLQPLFDIKIQSDQMGFCKAYQNVNQMNEVATSISTLQDAINRADPRKLQNKCNELFDIASELGRALKTNPMYSDVSSKASKQLQDHLYNVAEWIEFYGVHIQQVNTMAIALIDTEKKILKAR